ncbi:MAG: riboflavin biosynthesis protein RibF [Clostridia bacterium]|nr:riboflavin biosynthesis protein RibF [Clostridia bacterium]
MKITDLTDNKGAATVMALGIFDGLHIAHTKIIGSAVDYAKEHGCVPAVFTIKGSPKDSLKLITRDMFDAQLDKMGVNFLVCSDFEDIRDLSPLGFFNHLTNKYNVKAYFCGFNFRFGKKAEGDCDLLKKMCEEHGLECFVFPKYEVDGAPVSSSRIRQCLKDGDAELAAKLLGRPFSYNFTVVTGNKIGRLMQTPTINQVFTDDFCVPKYGVYASYARVDGKVYHAVTNIGVKPTVGAERPLSETWIADFSGNLYGRNIEVGILKFLRPEQKFESIEALRTAILNDARHSEEILRKIFGEVK